MDDALLLRRPGSSHLLRANLDVPAVSLASNLPRLLLVERDAAMRVMLANMLCTHYRVEAVGGDLAARGAAELDPPDLLIIDLYLPGKDYLTLIRAMRAETRTTYMPIILLSASLHKEPLLRGLAAGASNFLLKPFNTAELLMCAQVEMELRGPLAQPGG